MLNRRAWLGAAAASLTIFSGRDPLGAILQGPTLTARRNPGCGCCVKWVDHLKAMNFTVVMTEDAQLPAYKASLGVPADLYSCHTGIVQGYAIEGHVPGDVILRMLDEKPAIAGLGVGGMPPGSPGMESPGAAPFDVIAFTRDGKRSVYQRWAPKA
jgi:hypothetical protein